MKRKIHLKGIGVDLNITKAVSIEQGDREFIYLEKMPDGNWRLTWTAKTIPDMTAIEALVIQREDE